MPGPSLLIVVLDPLHQANRGDPPDAPPEFITHHGLTAPGDRAIFKL
jgi:hypothetical protein